MISESRIRVRYSETDKMGVVYHSNYLIWFEVARAEFLEKLGLPYEMLEEAGFMAPVIDVHLTYGTPLTYGDWAIVRTTVMKQTAVKTVYGYEVYKEGQEIGVDKPCCTGTTTHCVVDSKTFHPVGLKHASPELYAAYLDAMEPDFV